MTLGIPPAATLTVTGTRRVVQAVNSLVARGPMTLNSAVEPLVLASGGSVGIALIELGGTTPLVWSYNGGEIFTAASTYKLAALMMEAQNIAAGRSNPDGLVCYVDDDYEAGWFDDYADGMCFTRTELAQRAGLFSDNTAGHMLVRDLGGAGAVNAWAASEGVTESVFFTANTTATGTGRYENFAIVLRHPLGSRDSIEAAWNRRAHKSTASASFCTPRIVARLMDRPSVTWIASRDAHQQLVLNERNVDRALDLEMPIVAGADLEVAVIIVGRLL